MEKPTAQHCIERENAIYAAALASGQDAFRMISDDRNQRWAAIVATLPIPDALLAWKAAMLEKHGDTAIVYGMPLGWITALLVVRYGQAEYNWPDAFSDGDISRAQKWLDGNRPEGVKYPQKAHSV